MRNIVSGAQSAVGTSNAAVQGPTREWTEKTIPLVRQNRGRQGWAVVVLTCNPSTWEHTPTDPGPTPKPPSAAYGVSLL